MSRGRLKRLLRISLRTVFVLATVLCVGLGWKVHRVHKQREAVAWVKEHGGIVFYVDHETHIPNGRGAYSRANASQSKVA